VETAEKGKLPKNKEKQTKQATITQEKNSRFFTTNNFYLQSIPKPRKLS